MILILWVIIDIFQGFWYKYANINHASGGMQVFRGAHRMP